MGLLDAMFGTPEKSQAMAMLSAGLLRGDLAGGLLGANQVFVDAPRRKMQEQLAQMQLRKGTLEMEGMERENLLEQQMRDAARASYVTPEQASALSMGPTPDGGVVPQVSPGFDLNGYMSRLYQIDPMKGLAIQQAMAKDNKPLTVAPGASLVDPRTMKPVFTAPKEQSLPAAIQEYQFAVGQGYKGTFDQWDKERKRAGANSVSLSVNTEKSFLNELAGGLGKSITDARGTAQASLGTINTVNRLMEALDSNQVMAGPGTTFRQYGLQVGSMLGVSGKDAQEKLLNTRQAIQSLAQLELDAAQQMKGQGQITEAERSIIRRAASGDIDGMTTGELRLLGGVLDRTARTKIQSYRSQVKPLQANPNAAPLAPFLDVEEPPQRAPSAQPKVRRYNPATGRIE